MNKLPKIRTTEIVEQDLGKELLIYNLTTHQAHGLNETSKIIYQACNGKTTFEELKRRHKFTDDLIYFALGQLISENLVEEIDLPFSGLSRREIVRRVGLATLAALPVISILMAPAAAHAASGQIGTYTCSNPGSNTYFCPGGTDPSVCSAMAKTQCPACHAVGTALGECASGVTCECRFGTCSNPGATESYFCAANSSGCSQARNRCLNCAATISTNGPCSSQSINKITCTCT